MSYDGSQVMTIENGRKLLETLDHIISDDKHTIHGETETEYSHQSITSASSITFYGNADAFRTARYADKKNVAPFMTYNGTKYGVDCVGGNYYFKMNGTASSTNTFLASYIDFDSYLPAGDYKVIAYVDKHDSVLPTSGQFVVTTYYASGSTSNNYYLKYDDKVATVTASSDIRRIAINAGVISGNVYDNYTVWFGIFPADVTITDTEHSVASNGTYTINISGNHAVIDTMQHQSKVSYMANIKTYVDQNIPDNVVTDEDLVYVTPEMFETSRAAMGDDYAVINACITYAIAHHVPVRGYGNYTISQGLVIEADDADIFLNTISTTMQSGSVITLTGYRNKVNVNKIYAETGNCVGFTLYGKYNHWTEFNTITLPYIFTKKDCIVVDCLNQSPGDAFACQNKIYTQYIRSSNENCIHTITGYGENQFYGGGQVICPNGWAIYNLTSGNKFFNFALETYARSGIYNTGMNNYFTGFRIAELRGQKTDPASDVGTLIKFVGPKAFANIFECADAINIIDIDVSEATANEDITAQEAEVSMHINIVRGSGVRGRGYDTSGNISNIGYYTIYGKEVITLRNKKIVIPYGRLQMNVTSNIDYVTDEFTTVYANWFTVKSASTITLNDSYCPIGFNEIYVDQTDAKVTIYKGNNIIFNGSQYGNGLYKLVCYCDMVNNVYNNLRPGTATMFYDGENEAWTVEQVPIATSPSNTQSMIDDHYGL